MGDWKPYTDTKSGIVCQRPPSHFKGRLHGVGKIVVKKIDPEEFSSTITLMSRLRWHYHVVHFLGYCERNASVVYEFMPYGSLDEWIFREENQDPDKCLTWSESYTVAKAIRYTLDFLCNFCDDSMIALPQEYAFQAESFLMDGNLKPKLRDYDSFLCYPRDRKLVRHLALRPCGMLLLEIVTGRRRSYLLEKFPGLDSYDLEKYAQDIERIKNEMVKERWHGDVSFGDGLEKSQLQELLDCVLKFIKRRDESDRFKDFEKEKMAPRRQKRIARDFPPAEDYVLLPLI